MVHGAADEDAVGELSDLNGEKRGQMAGVADGSVEGEEMVEVVGGDVGWSEEVAEGEGGGIGVEEVDAGVVAGDVDVAVGVGGETAGERREEREREREREDLRRGMREKEGVGGRGKRHPF